MVNSISTYGVYQAVLNASNRTKSAMATAQIQESSGLKSQTLGGLGATSGTVLNLQSEIAKAQNYSTQASTAYSKTETMYSVVGSMVDVLTTLRSALSSSLSNSSENTLSTSGKSALDTLSELLNTQLGGHYLFSGTATTTAPVDTSGGYTGTVSVGGSDTSYYQGDDTAGSVQVSDDSSVSYGVTADNSAFEETLRVAAVASTGTTDSATLTSLYSLATNAISDLANVQGTLGVNAAHLEQVQSQEGNYATYLQSLVSSDDSVDVAVVATQVSAYQTQLEASYSALAAIFKLSLASYL